MPMTFFFYNSLLQLIFADSNLLLTNFADNSLQSFSVGTYFTPSNYTIFTFLVIITFFLFLNVALQKSKLQYKFWTLTVERFYFFLLNIVRLQGGLRTMRYFFLFYFLFFFIFFSNFLGLLPYGFAITSHIIHNFFISISCFITIIVLALKNHGWGFFKGFVPFGLPVWLTPLIVVIEVISYFIRPLSLAIRLFANMMAGHSLLHILMSFFFSLKSVQPVLALLPLFFLFVVFLFEFGVAFIQAYVFVLLLSLFFKDGFYGH